MSTSDYPTGGGAVSNVQTLTTGQVSEIDLTDTATNSVSSETVTTHGTSGVPVAGFGSSWLDRLANAANTLFDSFKLARRLVTATAGAEDTAVDIYVTRAAALVKTLILSGKNASGNYPVEFPLFNADQIAAAFTANGDQELQKFTGGNINIRARNALDAQASMLAANNLGVVVHMSTGHADVIACDGSPIASDVDGYLWIPAIQATGAPSGVPRGVAVGQSYTGHTALVANRADNKIWGYIGTALAWGSQTLIQTPTSILAALTNNCTPSGTTGTIPNWTSLTVYATDAQAIHDAVSQLAKKVVVLETALRQNTSMAIT